MAADDVIHGYAKALFSVVQAEGEIERVEDELYRFSKVLDGNHELKQALSDKGIDRGQRMMVLEDLLTDKVSPHTLGLLTFIVGQGRGRQMSQILQELSELAAEARNAVVAEVRSATPLDSSQRTALQGALSRATGKNVAVKVMVDPSLIGGIVAKIGETIIDGSVKRRLEQLKDQVRA